MSYVDGITDKYNILGNANIKFARYVNGNPTDYIDVSCVLDTSPNTDIDKICYFEIRIGYGGSDIPYYRLISYAELN